MSGFAARTDGIRSYAATAGSMSEQVAQAGGMNVAESLATLGPVFGLIGADFLAAFGAVLGTHVASIGGLAAVLAGTADNAAAIAGAYDAAEESNAASLRSVGAGLGVHA